MAIHMILHHFSKNDFFISVLHILIYCTSSIFPSQYYTSLLLIYFTSKMCAKFDHLSAFVGQSGRLIFNHLSEDICSQSKEIHNETWLNHQKWAWPAQYFTSSPADWLKGIKIPGKEGPWPGSCAEESRQESEKQNQMSLAKWSDLLVWDVSL